MTLPPDLAYKEISADEAKRLISENDVESSLGACATQRTHQPQDVMHEQFCCKKDFVLYTDASGDEVASVIEQIHANATKGITRTFVQLRIQHTIYRLRIP